MELRRLGKTDYQVSQIGLGCWQLGGDFGPMGGETADTILAKAVELGVNFWDTADVYGGGLSESRVGIYLPKAKGTRVATKVGRDGKLYPDQYTRTKVRESLEASAKRLGVSTIDLAQLHCVPEAVLRDGEIFEWMDDLQKEGLIRHWGASVETIEEALLCIKHPGVATLQIIFNLFRQDAIAKLFAQAQAADVGIIVRLPLASGVLSGKFGKDHKFDDADHRNYNRDGAAFSVGETFSGIPFEKGVELAAELAGMAPEGWPLSHLALRWILDQPAVSTIIAGVSRPDQLADNVAAGERPPLPAALIAELAQFYADKVRPNVRGDI